MNWIQGGRKLCVWLLSAGRSWEFSLCLRRRVVLKGLGDLKSSKKASVDVLCIITIFKLNIIEYKSSILKITLLSINHFLKWRLIISQLLCLPPRFSPLWSLSTIDIFDILKGWLTLLDLLGLEILLCDVSSSELFKSTVET